jgi:hypothetical protein
MSTLVMPSPRLPLSLREDRASEVGAAAAVSMVSSRPVLLGEVLLPESVCVTFRVCGPSDSVALLVMLQLPEPSAAVLPSTVVPSVS